MVPVVGRISTLTLLCYKKKGMAAKSAFFSHINLDQCQSTALAFLFPTSAV